MTCSSCTCGFCRRLPLDQLMAALPALAWIKPSDVLDEHIAQVATNLRARTDESLVAMWQWAERAYIDFDQETIARYLVTLAERGDVDGLRDAAQALGIDPLASYDRVERSAFSRIERRIYSVLGRAPAKAQSWFAAFAAWLPTIDLGEAPETSPQRVCPIYGCRDVPRGLARYCSTHLAMRRAPRAERDRRAS